MLTVTEFRAKYPNSTEEQVALYGQAVAAERARGPVIPEPDNPAVNSGTDVPMPRITITVTEVTRGQRPLPEIGKGPPTSRTSQSRMTSPNRGVIPYWNHVDIPAPTSAPDLTSDNRAVTSAIRRIVLGRRLTPRERAQAERPDMSSDDLLALLAGVPNAREWEALEGD